MTTLELIMKQSGSSPSACSCDKCRRMCRIPCIGTPEDIERLVDAGYTDRLAPTEWLVGRLAGLIDRPIYMIQPVQQGGWCTFYHDGLCELHDRGLKPTEGKLSHHADEITHKGQDLSNNMTWLVAKEWIKDENLPVIVRLCEKIKRQIK